MTPKCKTANSTTLVIERRQHELEQQNADAKNIHVAGGDHTGIVINKQAMNGNFATFLNLFYISSEKNRTLTFSFFLSSLVTYRHQRRSKTSASLPSLQSFPCKRTN